MPLYLIEKNTVKLDGHVVMISTSQTVSFFFNQYTFIKRTLFLLILILVQVSVDILKAYLNINLARVSLEIEWPTLRYLIGEGKF